MRLSAARVSPLGNVEHEIDAAWGARRGRQCLFEEPAAAAHFHRIMPGRAEGGGDPVDRLLGIVFLQQIGLGGQPFLGSEICFQVVGDTDANGRSLTIAMAQAESPETLPPRRCPLFPFRSALISRSPPLL